MKKLFSLLLLLTFTVSLIGCTSNSKNETAKSASTSEDNSSFSSDNKSTDKSIKKDTSPNESEKKASNDKVEEKEDLKKDSTIKKKVAKQTASNIKEKNKITIVIDPGHSNKLSKSKEPNSPDSDIMKLKDTLGSTGVNSKVPEYKTTMGVSLELAKILKKQGFNVILTKDSVPTQMSNIERAKVGNNANADLVIRIHCDGVDSKSAHGASMLVPATKGYVTNSIAKKSASYGRKIIDTYTSQLGIYNRGLVTRSDLTGFNWSKVPVVLLELGFISNPKEDALISNQKNYHKIADAIANGIDKCF